MLPIEPEATESLAASIFSVILATAADTKESTYTYCVAIPLRTLAAPPIAIFFFIGTLPPFFMYIP